MKRTFLPILWAIGLLLALGLALFVAWAVHRPYKGYPQDRTFVEIERGESARSAARRLEQTGVIRSAGLFSLYLLVTGQAGGIKAGEYLFDGSLSISEVAAKLYRGEVFLHKVTIPEGLVFQDIKRIFLQAGFGSDGDFDRGFREAAPIRDLDPEAKNLEGYLFPETYLLRRGARVPEILGQMVQNFRERFDGRRLQQAQAMKLAVRQVVTLASLIEKETGIEEERYLISSVFHNRLKRGMLLECDPTVIYAVRLVREWDGVIHRSDLALDSPYNTYRYAGLPPGPIASPGIRSLDAALYPQDTRYLYFVSRNDGRHVFSENLSSHARAVAQYQRRGPVPGGIPAR